MTSSTARLARVTPHSARMIAPLSRESVSLLPWGFFPRPRYTAPGWWAGTGVLRGACGVAGERFEQPCAMVFECHPRFGFVESAYE